MRRGLLFIPPAAFLGLFFAYPLAKTLSAATAVDPWRWAMDDYVQERLWLAAAQAFFSVLLTLALALPLAWHHHRRAIPWGRVHLALHAAPFVLPVFVVVNGMRELFGAGGWIDSMVGVDVLAAIGPLGAVVIAHAYYNYGFAARLLHAALERRPHRLEHAAHTLGASPLAAFVRITLPLLLPALAAVALLVFLFCFTSFGVVLFLGGSHVATLETLLYQNLGGAFPRYDRAAVLGVLQLGLNILLLGGYFALRRKEVRLARDPWRAPMPARRRDTLAAGVVLVIGLLPALAVLLGGFRVRGRWTLEAWRALLDADHPSHLSGFDLGNAIARSLIYASTSALLALGLAIMLGYALQRAGRLRKAVEAFAAMPLGTSSVLLGFGYILAFGAGSWLDLRGNLVQITLAHALVAFPFVARAFMPALDQHDRRMDEVAALLGADGRGVLLRVHWPMLRGPLIVALGFAVAISLGDFGASLLLMRRETMSLSVWIGQHDRPFDLLLQAQSVALSAVLMVLASVAYLVVERFRRIGEGDL